MRNDNLIHCYNYYYTDWEWNCSGGTRRGLVLSPLKFMCQVVKFRYSNKVVRSRLYYNSMYSLLEIMSKKKGKQGWWERKRGVKSRWPFFLLIILLAELKLQLFSRTEASFPKS